MFLTRWQRPEASWPTFGRLSDLRDELDRLFSSPLSGVAQLTSGTPALDLYEDKDNFTVTAELPGLKREDIEVSLHEGALSISGERKSEEKFEDAETYRSERFFGKFHRVVTLPKAVQGDKITAQYKDGILTVTLPKAEEAKPKQITVKVN